MDAVLVYAVLAYEAGLRGNLRQGRQMLRDIPVPGSSFLHAEAKRELALSRASLRVVRNGHPYASASGETELKETEWRDDGERTAIGAATVTATEGITARIDAQTRRR